MVQDAVVIWCAGSSGKAQGKIAPADNKQASMLLAEGGWPSLHQSNMDYPKVFVQSALTYAYLRGHQVCGCGFVCKGGARRSSYGGQIVQWGQS